MNPTELREIGEALYGPRFASQLARDLGVDVRTMQRWLAGQRSIPHRVRNELRVKIEDRAALLTELAKTLRCANNFRRHPSR